MAKGSGGTRSGNALNPRGVGSRSVGGGLSAEDRDFYANDHGAMASDWYQNRRNAKGKAIENLAKEWHREDMRNAATPTSSSLKKEYANGEQAIYSSSVGNHTNLNLTRDYDGTYYASVETAGFGVVQLHSGRWKTTLNEAKSRSIQAFDEYRKQKTHGSTMRFDY